MGVKIWSNRIIFGLYGTSLKTLESFFLHFSSPEDDSSSEVANYSVIIIYLKTF